MMKSQFMKKGRALTRKMNGLVHIIGLSTVWSTFGLGNTLLAQNSTSSGETGAGAPQGQAASSTATTETATPAGSTTSSSPAKGTSTHSNKQTAASTGRTNVSLNTVVVTGTTPADAAKQDLYRNPGSAYVSNSSERLQTKSNTATAASLLQYIPGVYAQAEGNNQGFRLSIRGSSVSNTNTYKYGVSFYFDGLTFPGFATAGVPPFIFEPLAVDYTTVLPGSNAFDFGSLTLGGAVNFVDHTGYDAPTLQLRFDAGSYGYYKGQISSGIVDGNADFYESVTESSDQGYQAHTEELGTRVVGNIGYQISPDISNRFYYRFGNEFFKNGGLLTNAQISNSPRIANATTAKEDAYYNVPDNFFFGDKATIKLDSDSNLELGLSYSYSYMYSNAVGVAGGYAASYAESTISPSFTYNRSDILFDRQSNTTLSLRLSSIIDGDTKNYNYTLSTTPNYGQTIRDAVYGGSTEGAFTAANEYEVIPNLWIKTGAAATYDRLVDRIITAAAPVAGPINNANDDQGRVDWKGVLGLRYDFTPDVQVFTDVSRSVEPTTASGTENANDLSEVNLKNQTATTVEVGTRAKAGIFDGSLTFYRSWVDNELLTVATQLSPTLVTQTSNATPTIHQGIEAALSTTLWEDKNNPPVTTKDPKDIKDITAPEEEQHGPSTLVLRQAYTLSDNHFVNDPSWGSARLPAVPENFYQAELRFQHWTGAYIGVSTQYSDKIWEDFANTISSPSYVTLGAEIGYAPPKAPWEVHMTFSNITNEHYAAYIRQTADAKGVDTAVAAPADGFGVFGGFSYHF
jgi:iron complex outermembrane recepter protein